MLYQRILPNKTAGGLPQRIFCTAVALLLVLSEVFSSNIQETLPGFSRIMRLALTGAAVALLLAKLVLFTDFAHRWQLAAVCAALCYSGFAAAYGGDIWFFIAVLAGLAAKDVDLRQALRVYLAVAAACMILVQLLHYATALMPYHFYCRNWDFGYGHYNGYGARIFGVFMAWGWLRSGRFKWFDRAGLAALALYTLLVPGCRGAGIAMLLFLLVCVVRCAWPKIIDSRFFYALSLLAYPLLAVLSLLGGLVFDPSAPQRTPLLAKINSLLSGRLEIWHHVFWGFAYTHPAEGSTPAWLHDNMPNIRSFLGGFESDGDMQHAIDNTFLALIVNKGYLGAVIVAVCVLLLLYRLCRRRCVTEVVCIVVLFAYLLMENKPFLLTANPLFLLLPVLLTPKGERLPVLQVSESN